VKHYPNPNERFVERHALSSERDEECISRLADELDVTNEPGRGIKVVQESECVGDGFYVHNERKLQCSMVMRGRSYHSGRAKGLLLTGRLRRTVMRFDFDRIAHQILSPVFFCAGKVGTELR